jgi:dephospho-CoA kinase
MMRVLVVTGGIGSGKSIACEYFKSLGLPVYDSDSRTKLLYDLVPSLVDRLEVELGTPLKDESTGKLDRKKLASIIFSDPSQLAKLESLVHPEVMRDFNIWAHQHQDAQLLVFESAIVLEKPLFAHFGDYVLELTASEQIRLERACARDKVDKEAVAARIRTQAESTRVRQPDFTIRNESDLESLKSELLSLYLYLCAPQQSGDNQ